MDGDMAANSLLINQALHQPVLHGWYSRVGTNHPGPFLVYVEAAGELVWYRWLHIAASPFGGHFLAAIAFNASILATVITLTARRAGRVTAVVLVGLLLIVGWFTPSPFEMPWGPAMMAAPYLLLVVATLALMSHTEGAAPFALAATILIHAHFSSILFVCVAVASILAMWGARHEALSQLKRLGTNRAVWTIVCLGVAPIVLDVVVHGTHMWRVWGASMRSDSLRDGHSFATSLRFAADALVPSWWLGVIVVGCAITLIVGAVRCNTNARIALAALCPQLTAIVPYSHVGVDRADSSRTYLLWFVIGLVPLLCAASVPVGLGTALRTRFASGLWPAVTCMSCAILTALWPLELPFGPAPWVAEVNEALPAEVRLNFTNQSWPLAIGILDYRIRRGETVCLDRPPFAFMATEQHICTANSRGITLIVDTTQGTPPGELYATVGAFRVFVAP